MIYFDNAATSWPKPESVYRAMDGFLREKGGNPGRSIHKMAAAAMVTIEETRMLVARFINALELNRIVFTLNCTDALNIGLKGFLKPGDHVITSSIGHNSLVRPLEKLRRQGVQITRVPPSRDGIVPLQHIEKTITESTKLIVVTHASNVTGVIQPIEEYGLIARKHGLIFMVDAAQTAGKHPIDVQAGNIDLLAFSGHKGLFGPPGTGVLYVGSRVDLDSLREGGSGSNSEQEEQPGDLPYRHESGTLNSVGICGLGAGVKYILAEGLDRICAHERQLTDRLIEGLSKINGVTIYRANNRTQQAPVVSLNIEGYEPGEVGIILDQAFDICVRTGLHCAPLAHRTLGTFPRGTVRLSLGYFNTAQEVDYTLLAIEKIAESKNIVRSASEKCGTGVGSDP